MLPEGVDHPAHQHGLAAPFGGQREGLADALERLAGQGGQHGAEGGRFVGGEVLAEGGLCRVVGNLKAQGVGNIPQGVAIEERQQACAGVGHGRWSQPQDPVGVQAPICRGTVGV